MGSIKSVELLAIAIDKNLKITHHVEKLVVMKSDYKHPRNVEKISFFKRNNGPG